MKQRRSYFVKAMLGIGVFVSAPAIAQPDNPLSVKDSEAPAKEVASANQLIFADFPAVVADLPFAPYEKAWPARWTMQANGIRGVIVPVNNPAQFPDGVRTAGYVGVPESHPDVAAVLAAKKVTDGTTIALDGPGGFVYRIVEPGDDKPIPRGKKNTASSMFKFVSAQETVADGKPVLTIERTWFTVYDAVTEDGAKPRGVALVSPGLLGTPVGTLNSLTEQLRKNGWVVLRMLSQPSRFTEMTEFRLDAAGDLEAQATNIASVTGNRSAECAYAVQAAFAHVEATRPELKELPRVAVGFSGGAMTLPTIIALEPDRYVAAIMVGGGADFWLMNQRSNYRDLIRAVKENWAGEKPSAEALAKLDEQYLRHAPLDSYHTAASLKGKKVLLIQGTADRAVPSPLGDLLWLRLGKPERWLEEGAGHEALFMNLPRDYYPKMMQWLDQASPREEHAADAGKQPAGTP